MPIIVLIILLFLACALDMHPAWVRLAERGARRVER